MLQKVVVSRRMLLKGLGMGAGMVAVSGLSGCTQFLKRSESSIPLAPAGASNAHLAQLAHEAKEAWKEVFLSIAQDFDQAITSARVTQADKERFIAASSCKGKKKEQPPPPPGSGS